MSGLLGINGPSRVSGTTALSTLGLNSPPARSSPRAPVTDKSACNAKSTTAGMREGRMIVSQFVVSQAHVPFNLTQS